MIIQAMHKNTGFLLNRCENWTAVEDSSQWGLQLPILHKGAAICFP